MTTYEPTRATRALKLLAGEAVVNPTTLRCALTDLTTGVISESDGHTTEPEGRAFAAAFHWWPMRAWFWVLHHVVYRFGRWSGAIPAASSEPWYDESAQTLPK